MSDAVRWLAGEAALCARLERALLDPQAAGAELTVLRDRPRRRRLYRLRLREGPELFIKHHYAGGRRHALRGRLMRALRLDGPRREWRSLVRLRGAGVRVPEPRALGVLPNGDRVLAVDHLEARPLEQELAAQTGRRTPLVLAVADLVAALHAAGHVHRDLHHQNILVTARGPVLVDLQAAGRRRSGRARDHDLGELDRSLRALLPLAQRVRLRARALGLRRPFTPDARRRLRAVGRASRQRARARAASRMRRARQPGRRCAPLRFDGARGLRLRAVDEALLVAALRARRGEDGLERLAHDERTRVSAVVEGGRRMVVKEFRPGGWRQRIADLLRGSPARRAWLGGHGLRAHGIGAAAALAYLERRRLGLPTGSILVLEDPRPAFAADSPDAAGAGPEEIVDALTRLLLELHDRGVAHRDLRACRVWLARRDGRLETRLVDLEGLRFPRRLGEAGRLRALAQLNASLPDSIPDAPRRRGFARYAALLPFRVPARRALQEVVERSLAGEHRWTGTGCALAPLPGAAPRPARSSGPLRPGR